MQRTQLSFINNVKERKEHNILFIKNAKEHENAHSFEKNGCPTLVDCTKWSCCELMWHLAFSVLIAKC